MGGDCPKSTDMDVRDTVVSPGKVHSDVSAPLVRSYDHKAGV